VLPALLIVCGAVGASAGAVPAEPLPRRVYAHYYGGFTPGRGATAAVADSIMHKRVRIGVLQYEGEEGNPYRIGAFPLIPLRYLRPHAWLRPLPSIDLDVRRAMRAGIDGFAVNAWTGGSEARRGLHVLFQVVERGNYPFEITLSIDPNDLHDSWNNRHYANHEFGVRRFDDSYERMLHAVEYLVNRFGDHPNLARRDGKPLIFIENGSMLLQGLLNRDDYSPPERQDPDPDVHATREALDAWNRARQLTRLRDEWRVFDGFVKTLEARAGCELFVVMDAGGMNRISNRPQRWIQGPLPSGWREYKAGMLGGLASAVTLQRPGDAAAFDLERAGQQVRETGAEWCYPLLPYYESYAYRAPPPVFAAGAERFRSEWEAIMRQDVSLVLLHSWNDYRSLSHIAPDLNHHYVKMLLTAYYTEFWKTGREPMPDEDILMALFHRYPPGSDFFPGSRRSRAPEIEHSALEVIAWLRSPGRVRVPGRGADGNDLEWEAPAGLSFRQVPLAPGPVTATLSRAGSVVTTLECAEWISANPFRQDHAQVGESTAFQREWDTDFSVPPFAGRGGIERPFYSEYGDLDGDGLPNWFEVLFSDGRWMHPRDVVAMYPDGRAFGGLTVIEAYRQRRDPRLDQAPSAGISDDLLNVGGRVDEFDIDALLGE